MEKFLNKKYKLDRSENLDEFLTELGKAFLSKQRRSKSNLLLSRIQLNNEEDSKNPHDDDSVD